jgi:hypothetical protein
VSDPYPRDTVLTRAQEVGYEDCCSRALVEVCVDYLFFALSL